MESLVYPWVARIINYNNKYIYLYFIKYYVYLGLVAL